ncbi:di-trans,poly-cis-decaprenylcistransferase [Candidatus Roizmanbacteria bacterium RIFCSPHIGHO2_01_FULL_39_12c]|uniref:Isoprenyl transferase n=1 Tax=Candidatus Roizmanbacteria bacterium RIFCSPHIGHO2_01_FULL_39_12c TaxID=1802031 RepID=A0A1F7GBI6_9BACT|nr:MAG: di-trans,poly-cis-decaprenylcistransferase [Candidatus Roizmanbacteria bacterium RIFCSPHIGHO2_01_FULL_39_12c]OGK47869.1 MAG: di-trans,poly-cis-decaprenylcistransferase [Candidatus Roizmanbacteria bacterium RIFCSPLOWO2_01_FULL_40_13]
MNIPIHVAIIPDGNRRWAKKRGLLSFEGHRNAAQKVVPNLIKKAGELGIKYFTIWAMSTENFNKRSKLELNGLFTLMKILYKLRFKEIKKNGIKVKIIGDISKFPKDIQKLIEKVLTETAENKKATLIFALNYGGRDEIVRAINKISNIQYPISNLNTENFSQFLDTDGIPDPDLIIRTGGEKRLSGFLPWQSVYSELYFSNLYFPDFDKHELEKAIQDYSLRKRRFGR